MFNTTSREETFELPVVEGYGCEVNGNVDACIESFDDQLAVIEAMHALDIAEIEYGRKINALRESGADEEEIKEVEDEEEAVTEASIKEIFARIKEAILKLWAKIKEFFKTALMYFNSLILSGKDFVKKYKKQIEGCKPFLYERYTYTVDSHTSPKKVLGNMKWAKEKVGKMGAKQLDEFIDQIGDENADKCRAFFLKKSGEVSSDEFAKELFKEFRNGKDYKEEVMTGPAEYIKWLESESSSTTKVIDEFKSDLDKLFNEKLNDIKTAENEQNKSDKEINQKRAKALSKVHSALAQYQSVSGQYINAWKNAVKEYDSTAKSICVRAIAEKKKQAKEN